MAVQDISCCEGRGFHLSDEGIARLYGPTTDRMTAKKLTFTGDVSAPDYPDWIVHRARRLGLRGWVRAEAGDRVEVLVAGAPDLIDAMEVGCSLGPMSVLVDRVISEDASDMPVPNGFAILSGAVAGG